MTTPEVSTSGTRGTSSNSLIILIMMMTLHSRSFSSRTKIVKFQCPRGAQNNIIRWRLGFILRLSLVSIYVWRVISRSLETGKSSLVSLFGQRVTFGRLQNQSKLTCHFSNISTWFCIRMTNPSTGRAVTTGSLMFNFCPTWNVRLGSRTYSHWTSSTSGINSV